jgi:hypothetical protein
MTHEALIQMHDDLDDVFGPTPKQQNGRAFLPPERTLENSFQSAPQYVYTCGKCSGAGRFLSWSGRDCGPCHACKGTGKQTFRTSHADRAAAREKAASRKQQRADAAIAKFAEDYPAEMGWIETRSERFDFARAMQTALRKYGSLTENQLFAIQRCMIKDAEREEQKSAAPAGVEADLSQIEAGFDRARAKGLSRIGVTLAGFKFQPAPANGKNPGAVYVKTTSGNYLGKVLGGKLFKSRECTDEMVDKITAAARDPKAAAIEYGKLTGRCAICARELTDPVSIERGIGPICESNMGW